MRAHRLTPMRSSLLLAGALLSGALAWLAAENDEAALAWPVGACARRHGLGELN